MDEELKKSEKLEFHKIKLVSDLHGKRTFIYLDGIELKFVTEFKFEVTASGYNKVTLALMGDVDLDIEVLKENYESKTI